jgi:hypothetical protein
MRPLSSLRRVLLTAGILLALIAMWGSESAAGGGAGGVGTIPPVPGKGISPRP